MHYTVLLLTCSNLKNRKNNWFKIDFIYPNTGLSFNVAKLQADNRGSRKIKLPRLQKLMESMRGCKGGKTMFKDILYEDPAVKTLENHICWSSNLQLCTKAEQWWHFSFIWPQRANVSRYDSWKWRFSSMTLREPFQEESLSTAQYIVSHTFISEMSWN